MKCTIEPVHARIMHAFHRIRRVNISALMEVSQSEFFALQMICREKEEYPQKEGIYVSKLAEKLRIASSQTSRMLRNLEEKDLIGRSVDTRDRRNTYVFLTEKGIQVCNVTQKRLNTYISQVSKEMGEERIEELVKLCNELAEVMEKEAERQIEAISRETSEQQKDRKE